jgi:hypothetical protein
MSTRIRDLPNGGIRPSNKVKHVDVTTITIFILPAAAELPDLRMWHGYPEEDLAFLRLPIPGAHDVYRSFTIGNSNPK